MAENNNSSNNYTKGGDKPSGKKPSFNFYWIYAILIGVVLLSGAFLNGGSSNKVTQKQFEEFVTRGHIEKVLIISNKEEGRIYIKQDSLTSANKIKEIGKSFFGTSSGPHYFFKTDLLKVLVILEKILRN